MRCRDCFFWRNNPLELRAPRTPPEDWGECVKDPAYSDRTHAERWCDHFLQSEPQDPQ
jgi:hypothetical protein